MFLLIFTGFLIINFNTIIIFKNFSNGINIITFQNSLQYRKKDLNGNYILKFKWIDPFSVYLTNNGIYYDKNIKILTLKTIINSKELLKSIVSYGFPVNKSLILNINIFKDFIIQNKKILKKEGGVILYEKNINCI